MIRAKDIMSTNVISVKKDDPIFEAVKLLVENNISGLPVVDDDMILTGILSEKDVVDLHCLTYATFWERTSLEEFRSHQTASWLALSALRIFSIQYCS